MDALTCLGRNIYRQVVPFEDIFTTVFWIRTQEGVVLFDTATYPEDIDRYLEPAREELGITEAELRYVVISHGHRDHAGGLERFLQLHPDVTVICGSEKMAEKFETAQVMVPKDGDCFAEVLQIVTIPGHTATCIGVLDQRSGTLLTGDGLQLYGIYGSGNWGANISYPTAHLEALKKLREMEVQEIVASHEYHPCGYRAEGKEEVERYLEQCKAALYAVRDAICENSTLTDEELALHYNQTSKLPTMGKHVFSAVRKEWLQEK